MLPDRLDGNAVVVRHLTRSIGSATILADVGIDTRFGEVVGLVGPNGAGKTTLLKVIGGLIGAQSGSVLLAGDEITRLSARAVARMTASLGQDQSFTFGFTGLEAVLMGRTPHLGAFAFESERDHRIAFDAMRRTGTAEFARRIVTELSGGERQRVAMARALAQQPKILLLDEPTANLDIGHRHQLMRLVRELTAEGVAVIAAMHDLELAAEYCDRLVLLDRGRVVAEGPPEQVLTTEAIARTYEVWAACHRNPITGKLQVVVLPNLPAAVPGSPSVHVIAGGGAGAATMLALRRAGYRVTACPLSSNDSDAQAASALGIVFPPKPPFAPPAADQIEAHGKLIARAAVVVVAPTPFGQGNLENLRGVKDHPAVVIVDPEGFAGRDYTEGQAAAILREIGDRAVSAGATAVAEAVTRILAQAERLQTEP